MSLIHQALKKVEGSRTHAASAEYAFKTGRVRRIRRYGIPVVFFIAIILAAYFFLAPARDERPRPSTAVKTPLLPHLPAKALPMDLNAKGMDEFRAGRYRESEGLFRKALLETPGQEGAHNNLGLALMRLGKKGEAEAAFKKALEIRPVYPEALNNYACLLAESGKTKKTLPMLEKALQADPAYADARFNLAVLLDKKGDLQGAISAYEEFIRLEPSSSDAAQARKRLMYLRSELIVKKAGGK